jgi:hypothetical protein
MSNVFPTLENNWNHDAGERRYELVGGLTKRELFAAMAMQGLCANSIPGSQHQPHNVAREARQIADALLAELG